MLLTNVIKAHLSAAMFLPYILITQPHYSCYTKELKNQSQQVQQSRDINLSDKMILIFFLRIGNKQVVS